MSARRIGILGGTFDPPHLGHLLIAEAARVALELESVLFLPAGEPWLKAGRRITPARHRLRMLELAIADNPHFGRCDCEVRRDGPSYTVDTLEQLSRDLPPDSELYFIVGSDVLPEFHLWKEPEQILELCCLAVVERPGGPDDGIALLAERFPEAAAMGAAVPVHGPRVDCNASQLRQMLAQGRSVRYQIPDGVVAYIAEHGLYQDELRPDEPRQDELHQG